VSSRDLPDKSGTSRLPARQTGLPESTPDSQWDIDPAEIDRYLSGRPQRASRDSPSPQRSQRAPLPKDDGSSTSDQLAQLRKMVGTNRSPEPPRRETSPQRAESTPTRTAAAAQSRSGNVSPRTPSPQQGRSKGPQSGPAPSAGVNRSVTSQPASSAVRSPRVRQDENWADREQLLRNDPYVSENDTDTAYYDDFDSDDAPGDQDISERQHPSGVRMPSLSSRPKVALPSMPKIAMPQSVSQAAIFNDVVSLVIIGIAVVSLAAMAILVGNRIETLPLTIPTHVSASGLLEDVKSRTALWRLPLLGTFLTLMNVVIALFVARIDRFASRFILGASLVVQFVAWVAIIRIL
jgi:hypothetical protein